MTKEQHEQRPDQQQPGAPGTPDLDEAPDGAPGTSPGAFDSQTAQRPAAGAESGQAAPGDTGAEPGTQSVPDPAELHMLLEDARAKADQTHDQLLRARAEMENMKRRQAKELENAHKFALEGIVKELLLVRDSLELGFAAAQEPDANVDKLREGTELTLKQLGDVMTKFGVERVYPEGEPFNPEYHQAMSMQPRGDVPPNTVTNVIQSGYLLNGRLVRPALVMVSKEA